MYSCQIGKREKKERKGHVCRIWVLIVSLVKIGVRLGEWDVKKGEDCLAGFCSNPVVNIPVAERIAHEDFAPKSVTRENDIALLRLAHSVSFTDYIKPICLPIGPNVRNKDYRNTKLTVAGWGQVRTLISIRQMLRILPSIYLVCWIMSISFLFQTEVIWQDSEWTCIVQKTKCIFFIF